MSGDACATSLWHMSTYVYTASRQISWAANASKADNQVVLVLHVLLAAHHNHPHFIVQVNA